MAHGVHVLGVAGNRTLSKPVLLISQFNVGSITSIELFQVLHVTIFSSVNLRWLPSDQRLACKDYPLIHYCHIYPVY